MRAWKAVVLIDLALVLGVGAGYLAWGLRVGRLEGVPPNVVVTAIQKLR